MSESRDQSFRGAVRRCPDFCRGERFMISALRRWLRGGEDWQRAIRDAGRHLKPALAMSFTNTLNSVGEGLDGGARRMLRLRTPLSNHVSADERAIIALVGAIQHDRFEHAHALLNYLVQDHAGRTVMIHAVTIAKTMAKGGFNLAAPVAHRPIWTLDQIRLRAIA